MTPQCLLATYISCLILVCAYGSSLKVKRQTTQVVEPSYTVVQDYDGEFEHRRYNPTTLASFKTPACMSFKWAQSVGYFHLSGYVRRNENSENRRLSMGSPVLVKVDRVNDLEERCTEIYTTQFVISTTQQPTELPTPNNNNIILESAAGEVYVFTYKGETGEPRDRVLELRRLLNNRGLCYDKTKYFVAAYQSPASLIKRKNEIMIPVEEC